jgi:hypothetical protein
VRRKPPAPRQPPAANALPANGHDAAAAANGCAGVANGAAASSGGEEVLGVGRRHRPRKLLYGGAPSALSSVVADMHTACWGRLASALALFLFDNGLFGSPLPTSRLPAWLQRMRGTTWRRTRSRTSGPARPITTTGRCAAAKWLPVQHAIVSQVVLRVRCSCDLFRLLSLSAAGPR